MNLQTKLLVIDDFLQPIAKMILEYINNQDKYGYFDIYVMRRLIYSYISIANFDIGTQIYSYMYSNNAYDSTSTQDLLIRNLINILTFQNNRIEYSNTALQNINTDSNNSLLLYKMIVYTTRE